MSSQDHHHTPAIRGQIMRVRTLRTQNQNNPTSLANNQSPGPGLPTRFIPTRYEVSAGGICVKVHDGIPYVAVIARRTRSENLEWCLPKGHLEHGESPTTAALRELKEETGIHGRIICSIRTINYWFSGRNTRVNKTVHHFLMEYVNGHLTVKNDPDREGEHARWVTLGDLQKILAYPNERKIAQEAHNLLYPNTQITKPNNLYNNTRENTHKNTHNDIYEVVSSNECDNMLSNTYADTHEGETRKNTCTNNRTDTHQTENNPPSTTTNTSTRKNKEKPVQSELRADNFVGEQ